MFYQCLDYGQHARTNTHISVYRHNKLAAKLAILAPRKQTAWATTPMPKPAVYGTRVFLIT